MTNALQPNTSRDPLAELTRCRGDIEALDRQLVATIAARVALARQTAVFKEAANLPIFDPSREADVVRHAVAAARGHGLPDAAMHELFWKIVTLSRRAQQQPDDGGP
jgi:chorismate mutase